MKIAAHLHPQHASYNQIREAAIRAEEMGADILYNWDHFYPLYGEADGPHFEAWTMLASWAEVTSNVEIGCLVTCNTYRNPELLADMARTVDNMSNGRLILGIGSGWFERDYDEYGYEFGTAAGRLRELRDALPRIETRLAQLDPQPVRDIPVLIGGTGETMTLQYAARHAHKWHCFWNITDPGFFTHKNSVLNDWCEKLGRDSSEISRSVGLDWDSVENLSETLDEIKAAGVNEVTLGCGGPDYDMSGLAEAIAWRDGQ